LGETVDGAEVKRRMLRGERLVRRQGSRWAWLRRDDELWVFAEGHERRFRESQRAWLTPLLAHAALGEDALAADDTALPCLAHWLGLGALEWQSDGGDDD
jgi:hypothetical protein